MRPLRFRASSALLRSSALCAAHSVPCHAAAGRAGTGRDDRKSASGAGQVSGPGNLFDLEACVRQALQANPDLQAQRSAALECLPV